jgi:hypothetical protein
VTILQDSKIGREAQDAPNQLLLYSTGILMLSNAARGQKGRYFFLPLTDLPEPFVLAFPFNGFM